MLKTAYVRPCGLEEAREAWAREVAGVARRRAPSLRPRRSGLLVVDMQEHFLDPGSPAFLPSSPAILPVVEELIDAFRLAGRPAAFAVYATKPGSPMARRWRRPCPPRSRWARLGGGIIAVTGERIFVKSSYSAFRGTGLKTWLRRRGVEDLVVAGLMTNLCVESTVRDAFDEGFAAFVPLDGCAAAREDLHLGSLKSMACGFATVASAHGLVDRFGRYN